jgi:hypothetical protein
MPVRASVLPQATPGHAILRIAELDAPPEGLTLSIQRQQGPDSHLAEEGWRRTEAWLVPDQVVRIRGVLDFHVGPAICDRLAGIATVRLRVKEPDVGVIATTVVAWPNMLTSGAVDPSRKTEEENPFRMRRPRPAPATPPPAPPFEPGTPAPPRPMPELRAAREPLPEPSRSGMAAWLIAALALIVVATAGYYAYVTYFERNGEAQVASSAALPKSAMTPAPAPQPAAPSQAAAEPPKESIRDSVADYLATKPAPAAMVAKGNEYAKAGEMAGAFLVWRRAAEAGNPEAELEVAQFYDPLSPQPKSGFTPDGLQAADWYERAALAGNVEAQRKYGQLLAKGGAGLPADPAKARSWLQQAAAQNDPDAKKALEQLGK